MLPFALNSLAIRRSARQFSVMAHPILAEILRLPPAERIQVIEDAWESLAGTPENVPVPDWHRELLDDRLSDPAEVATRTWDEVQATARRSIQ